ncbi:MAG: glycosyltransferase family 2 protein [bacterium]|nr:glycosyltransferase family 2 protein [bacterium]
MNLTLTISIVTFNNEDSIQQALESIGQSNLRPVSVVVVDNDSHDKTRDIVASRFPGVTLKLSKNTGFGSAHNTAIREIQGSADYPAEYHLVMNPDVSFGPDVLEKLVDFMDRHREVGLVMPKVLYPDKSTQHLCKQLPTPFDLIGRRFIPGFLKPLWGKRLARYEFRHKDYNQTMEVPHLSGCFMMLRSEVFEQVGVFDERFFLYLEDVDYSRRIHQKYKTLYYPEVEILHHYHKGSYKRWKHLKYHIVSAARYFNKWGWFFDKERKMINRATE